MVTQRFIGTNIEILVYNWLTRRKIPFRFQSSLMGGYFSLGGAVVDFILEDGNIALRLFGEFWHRGVEKEGSDLIQKEMLMGMGYTVVDIWAQDLETRLDEAMNLAVQGIEVLH